MSYTSGGTAAVRARDVVLRIRVWPCGHTDAQPPARPPAQLDDLGHRLVLPSSSALSRGAPRPHKELLDAWMLLLAGDTVHGYKLHQQLHVRGLAVQPATMYRRLRRFEQQRWLASRWSAPIGGPRRHVYRLTSQGRAALQEMSTSIAATRAAYSAFARAHEHTVGQGADAAPAGDGARHPLTGDGDRAPPIAIGEPCPPAAAHLRPRAELLAGWLLLHLTAGATHGYDLRRDVGAVHHMTTDPGTMYRMLRGFEANAWVQSRWTHSAGGPRRRVYQLTPAGRRSLDRLAGTIATIRDGLDDYLAAYQDFLGAEEIAPAT